MGTNKMLSNNTKTSNVPSFFRKQQAQKNSKSATTGNGQDQIKRKIREVDQITQTVLQNMLKNNALAAKRNIQLETIEVETAELEKSAIHFEKQAVEVEKYQFKEFLKSQAIALAVIGGSLAIMLSIVFTL